MAIIKNSITFGSGFNITAEGPIDSRMVVEYISDLTTVWDSYAPAYEGMIVSVIEDGNVYTLIDSDFTDINNWKKQGGGIEIYSSVDELPQDAPNGTLATVVMDGIILTSLYTLKYPQHGTDQNLGTISSIYPVNILPTERIVQQTSTQIKFMSRSGSNGSYSTFIINVFGADLEWSLEQQGSNGNNRSGKLIYWEDGKYKVNLVDFDFINDELGSYTYYPISPIAPTKEMFADIDNFLVTPVVGKRTFLYVKNSTGWEDYDKVNKENVVILENKIEELDYKIDENANIIVNSVDELPSDVPIGTCASVLYKVEKTELLPVSKAFIAGGKVSGLTIVPPEKTDVSDFNVDTTANVLGLNFSNNSMDRGLIVVNKNSGMNAVIGTDGLTMPYPLVEYDSDGNLKEIYQSNIDKILGSVSAYRSIQGSDILDKYIFANKNTITYNTKLYVKNTSGWEPYSELVDSSVTTEKISEGAVTLDKLSDDVKHIISSGGESIITFELHKLVEVEFDGIYDGIYDTSMYSDIKYVSMESVEDAFSTSWDNIVSSQVKSIDVIMDEDWEFDASVSSKCDDGIWFYSIINNYLICIILIKIDENVVLYGYKDSSIFFNEDDVKREQLYGLGGLIEDRIALFISTGYDNLLPSIGQTEELFRFFNKYQLKDYLDVLPNFYGTTLLWEKTKSIICIWDRSETGESFVIPIEEAKKVGDVYSFSFISKSENCRYVFSFNANDVGSYFITVSSEHLDVYIPDSSVTTEKISEGAVTLDKLSDEVKEVIYNDDKIKIEPISEDEYKKRLSEGNIDEDTIYIVTCE